MKKHNFSAGPAILPQSVLKQASESILNFAGTGLSVLEVSHRGKEFVHVMDTAQALVKELLQLNDDWAVLFLTGGASSQFFMSAMNLLGSDQKAGYINTGTWSTKAIKEAKMFGEIDELASSKETTFDRIPKGYSVPGDLKYIHYTSNNTIYGTQYHQLPEGDTRLVVDMSSDIFSRPMDTERYDMIYAGAQKNLGPAGTTLAIVRKSVLGQVNREIPTMLDYQTHVSKGSMFNTPPVFPIYVSMLTLQWIKEHGGLSAMEKRNKAKADLFYQELDRNSLFTGHSVAEDRSLMNATFRSTNPDFQDAFVDFAASRGVVGIKGHRSIGGFRASMYNSMEIESVQVLVQAMQDFEAKHG